MATARRLSVENVWKVDPTNRCALCIMTDHQTLYLSSDEARQLAIDLVTAAELLDRKTGTANQQELQL